MAAPTTPLATLEHCFTLLTTGPGALTIDGNAVRHGLPPRPIPLDELRSLLHHLRPQGRCAAVDLLISRARAGSPAWLVGLAGVLLPGLRQLAWQQANGSQTAVAEAQALTWFRTALAAHGAAADQRIRWLLERGYSEREQHAPGRRMKRASTCSPASSNRAILAALQPSQILSGSYGLRTAGRQIDKAQIKAQMKIVASSDVGRPG